MIATALSAVVVTLTLLILVATLLPLSRSKAWWIRMWDFPRLQLSAAAALAAAVSTASPWSGFLIPVLAACLGYQLWRVRPYTRFARTEMQFAPEGGGGQDVTLLAANVLMENEDHEKVAALVERVDPDIVFLMETNLRWVEAMEPVLARYPTLVREPRDDYYGLVFATRLDAREARTVRLSTDTTPSVYAELTAPDGATHFRFVGLHPRPPVPGEDTNARDAQVLYAARFARRSGIPIVTMGDFNDVAWSDTSQRFKHVGGYLDPRIGRGLYSSFNANHLLIRCPIDQIFVTPDVAMVSFGRGPHVGSDHFPMVATVRLQRNLARELNRAPVPLTGAEDEEVEAGVAAHRQRLEAIHGRPD